MILIILAAVIFGFVHPGSKLFLDTGIDLFSFCKLYVLIRLLVQIPIVLKTKAWRISNSHQLKLLIGIGVVGALLQLMEFMGISKGLPVPIVTFLVYSHPFWSLLFSRFINKEPFTKESYLKLCFGALGMALITGSQFSMILSFGFIKFLAPLSAGLLIALWVSLSNKLKKTDEASSWTISFYYDLFALVALFGMGVFSTGTNTMPEIAGWLSSGWNFPKIIFYSILVGLLPNLLFYQGSHKVSAFSSSLILLIEPVVACLVSSLIWHDDLSVSFYFGAVFILLSAAPISEILPRISSINVKNPAVLVLFMVFYSANLKGSTLHLVEIVPTSQNEYTVSKELEQIKLAHQLAVADFKKVEPSCKFDLGEKVKIGSEDELFKHVKEISNSNSDIVVGLSRSSFARIGAKAAEGSKLQAISVGASWAHLAEVNPNFTSIVSPSENQWDAVLVEMKKQNCSPKNTVGVFDSGDALSRNFSTQYSTKYTSTLESSEVEKNSLDGRECFFIALNFSQAQKLFSLVSNTKAKVFGIGDWNIYSDELKRSLTEKTRSAWRVFAPTGWINTLNARSKKFTDIMKLKVGVEPSPIAAYTYDATLIAAKALCEKILVQNMKNQSYKKLPLLRDYPSRTANNFNSKMNIVRFGKGN